MQKNANNIGNGRGMQLTMCAQVRLGCTIHIFIIGVDRSALKGCVESAKRTEDERRDDAWRPTKRNVWPGKKKPV